MLLKRVDHHQFYHYNYFESSKLKYMKNTILQLLIVWISFPLLGQPGNNIQWTKDGNGYYSLENKGINLVELPSQEESIFVSSDLLTPEGSSSALEIKDFSLSNDDSKVLIFTNSQRVWRYETRGDYWVLDQQSGKLHKLGIGLLRSG